MYSFKFFCFSASSKVVKKLINIEGLNLSSCLWLQEANFTIMNLRSIEIYVHKLSKICFIFILICLILKDLLIA
jgi:hypothetical protein